MEGKTSFSGSLLVIFFSIVIVSEAVRDYGACFVRYKNYGKCGFDKFECLDGTCISRSKFCDGKRHCSDNSDERYCGREYVSTCPQNFYKCYNTYKCIPKSWVCDGKKDCIPSGDEDKCTVPMLDSVVSASRKAIQWLHNKTVPDSPTRKWGPLVHKSAVALYLSDPDFVSKDNSARKEITYELSIQLLSKINQKKLEGIPSSELASFVNALLVTCTDPRNFHGFNLVEELRSRVDKQNYTNPYVLLSLCNAGDTIKESDVKKLIEVFWISNRELSSDVKALALMALSCARNQTDSTVDEETIYELALELKQHQFRNGTVENLQRTLLAMQALYAAEPNEDSNNFDEKKALAYILENLKSDNSLGNFMLTYYALPVINCMSLVNISSSHCETVHKDEDTAVYDLVNHHGSKFRIRYSIWFGLEKNIERTLTLKVPANISFYEVMEIAAEIDAKYRFEYVVKLRKPYITAVSGILDDPENELFWFPYVVKDEKPSLLKKSTADYFPKNDDHIIMWYRTGDWIE